MTAAVERREAPPRLSARFAPGRDSRGRVSGRNSQSRPYLARGYGPGAGLAILRSAPTGGLANLQGASRRSIPLLGKTEKRERRRAGPKPDQKTGRRSVG